jgi:hypothetical protein
MHVFLYWEGNAIIVLRMLGATGAEYTSLGVQAHGICASMHDASGKQNCFANKLKRMLSTHIDTVKHFCVLQVLCAAPLFVCGFASGGFGLRHRTIIEMAFKFSHQ